MRNIHIVTGQTASGKTSYALNYAQSEGNIDLISADSRQIYKKLDIITGKDIPKNSPFTIANDSYSLPNNRQATLGYYLIDGVRLWGVDIVDPKIQFSSFDFKLVADEIITQHIPESITPLIVGGSYLYIKHLAYGFDIEVEPDWKLRKELDKKSTSELQETLKSLNPKAYEKLNNSDLNNPHRLIRKIEIAKNDSNAHSPQKKEPLYNIQSLTALKFDSKDTLEKTIIHRVEERIQQGAFEEVQKILSAGYSKNDPGLQTIGYKQIMAFIDGEITKEEAIRQWERAEIQYAKRQVSFMKQNKDIVWKEI